MSGDFSVDMRIDTKDRPGVLARLATTIAEQDSNINNVSVESKDGRHSVMRFTISVKSRIHLAAILRELRKQKKSILHVSRRIG